MTIYNYDDNGFYINECIADESPLEPGVFLIPANATTVQPLQPKEGFAVKFNVETNEFEYFEINTEPSIEEKILSEDEIKFNEISEKIQISKEYLNSTGWIWEKKAREVDILKTMTLEEFSAKYELIIQEQTKAVKSINDLELELSNINIGDVNADNN